MNFKNHVTQVNKKTLIITNYRFFILKPKLFGYYQRVFFLSFTDKNKMIID